MEDKEIVRLFWNREEQAISVTAEKYGAYCKVIAINILGNREDAGECVNDTFLNAWNSIPPARPENLATYLGKLTRNLALNQYYKNRAQKRGAGQFAVVLEELEEVVSHKENPETAFEEQELRSAINAFLAMLPMEKRNLFLCRYYYADSITAIAEHFKMTENNVSVSLNRIRKKLHKYLTERGFEL